MSIIFKLFNFLQFSRPIALKLASLLEFTNQLEGSFFCCFFERSIYTVCHGALENFIFVFIFSTELTKISLQFILNILC